MSNLHWREKLKVVAETAKNGEQIPEKSKNIGLGCFLTIIIVIAILLVVLSISLFQAGHIIGALISLFITVGLIFFIVMILKADKLLQL